MTLPHSATNGQANLSHYLGMLLRETRGTVDPDNLAEFDDILLPAFTDLFAAIDKLEARVSALERVVGKPPELSKPPLSLQELDLLKKLNGGCKLVGDGTKYLIVHSFLQVGTASLDLVEELYKAGYLNDDKDITDAGRAILKDGAK